MSSDKPEKVGSNPISAGYSRLVRSLSKGNPSTMSTTAQAESPPPSTSGSPQASRTTSTTSVETSTSGLTAIEKFKNMAAQVTTKKEKETLEWPPSSWIVNSSKEEKPPPEAVPLPIDTDESSTAGKEGDGATSEPASLARQIQAMLSNMSSSLPALPSVYSSTPVAQAEVPPSPSTPTPTPATPTANNDSTSQQTPTPPPPPAPGMIDSKLAALLSSASVMNGSISKGRQSVWTALERLRAPKPAPSPSPPGAQQPEGTAEETEIDDDDSSGVMLYAPLVPDDRSEVEIARSEVSYVDQDGGVVGKAEEDWNERREVLAKERLDTLRRRKHDSKEKEKEEVQAQENAVKKGKGKEPKPQKVREVRVWVPSPTQISFQATWWGYRL